MLTNKNSKFLFYHFNDCLERQARPTERVRNTIIAKDEYGMLELQRDNLSFFIEKILEYV